VGDGKNDPIVLCRECREPVQPGSRFCRACGHRIDTGMLDNERRPLTLLFSDVVDSTALSEGLDPEDLHDLLTSYRQICRDAIGRYQGHVSQFLGDGVMSYFGYPIAQEDDVVLAVHAALEIVDNLKVVNQGIGKRLGAELHVRVGLHTGIAVVGEVGPGGARDRLVVGETVNMAARIQSLAAVDTVVVSASTARLIDGHFEVDSLGPRAIKGFTRPVELFRVVSPTGARTKLEAAARGVLTPHVGRAREMAELTAAWQQARDGADRVVVVRGEAGIGKSRLIYDFRNTVLAAGGARVLECFCSPQTQATAFAPVIEMLTRRLLELTSGRKTPQAKLDTLSTWLGEHSRFGADALPLMATLLSIPGADEEPLRDFSPVRRRARTLELLREWLGWTAERLPVALLFEDLHWADPSTLDFLDLIVRDPPGGRTLLCGTSRPGLPARWSEDQAHTIDLPRLGGDDIAAMVTHVVGGRALPPIVARRIAERSEGVPLFVEEVTKALLESGALRIDADRYELAGPLDARFLPSTVEGSLIARFDRLGDSRGVAQLGAAVGREFSYPLIRAVTGLSDGDLRPHLDRLAQSELAFAEGEPPYAVYRFKHALIQDAIYATLLKSERTRVHERVFVALQEGFPDLIAARPEMAAYHAEHAGRREAAIPLLRDAGVTALGRRAVAEAVKHLAHGIELVDVVLDESSRAAMEIDLQAAIGPAYMATVGWAAPEVERSCVRLRDLAAAKGDGPRLFQAVWSLWTVDFLRGRLDPALDTARQVMGMAQAVGDPMLRIMGHHAVGYSHFYRGEYDDALAHAAEASALFELEQEKRLCAISQFSSTCAIRCYRTEALQVLGRHQEAAASLLEWRGLLDDLGHAPSRAYSLCQQSSLFYARGDFEQVHRLATEARALALSEGFGLWVPIADTFIAWASAQEGANPADAVDRMRLAKESINGSLTHVTEVELTTMFAETLLLAKRPREVFPIIEAALETARAGHLGHYVPELYRLQGEAARVMGDWDRAVAFYKRAIERAREMGAAELERRAAAALEQGEYQATAQPPGPATNGNGSHAGGHNVH
jgi:class 3 adenylate cyclase/tetratricopeptide (TPR) repeat protein